MTDTAELERLAAHYDERVSQHDGLRRLMPNIRSERGRETRDIHETTAGVIREVIALRAEAERLASHAANGWAQYNHWIERYRIAADERDAALARANAAEGDADRLAKALDRVIDWTEWPLDRFGPIIQQAEFALAAHTQRVNAKEVE